MINTKKRGFSNAGKEPPQKTYTGPAQAEQKKEKLKHVLAEKWTNNKEKKNLN